MEKTQGISSSSNRNSRALVILHAPVHTLDISENESKTGVNSENVHALEGVVCRKRVAPARSPAGPVSQVRRSRRLRSTLAAAPGLLAHALVTTQ